MRVNAVQAGGGRRRDLEKEKKTCYEDARHT